MKRTGISRFDECDVKISPNKERSFSGKEHDAILLAVKLLNDSGIKCVVTDFVFDFTPSEEEN